MSFLGVTLTLAALAALAGGLVVWRRWRAARREIDRVRATFARYVAPSVVDMLLSRKDERLFTGRAVRATILVCRIRNFAHFAETLTPDETLRYLNEFYALTGTSIQRHRGIIESFLGDGIVGVFGVPLENPTQEDDALRAALDMVRHVVAMRDRWARQGRKPFAVGIGVNSGQVIAGDVGFRDRREFTVVGTEATFAHRLQEAAFSLNAFIVASRTTCESLEVDYQLVPVSGVPLPGVRRLLDAFVVRGRMRGTESFTVPVDAMVETTIEPPAPAPPSPTQARTPSPPSSHPPATVPIPDGPIHPAGAPTAAKKKPAADEPPIARRVGLTSTAAAHAFGVPELDRGWMFPQDDATSFLPDPPAPRATYEDRSGKIDI